MSTAEALLLTADEFSRIPDPSDGSRQELVRGVIVTMPPPGFLHGQCQVTIATLVKQFVRANQLGRITVESGVITETGPDSVRGPDVAYWSYERLGREQIPIVYANVAPDLVVEVLSPGDYDKKWTAKVREYFAMGVRMVWVVDPLARTVSIYRQPGEGRVLWEDGAIDGEDVLPGFQSRVSEFFE